MPVPSVNITLHYKRKQTNKQTGRQRLNSKSSNYLKLEGLETQLSQLQIKLSDLLINKPIAYQLKLVITQSSLRKI